MTLSWEAPNSNGGSCITGYHIIEKKKNAMSSNVWARVTMDMVLDTTHRVTGLIAGSEYEFRVCAINTAGVGPPSESSGKRMAKLPDSKF